VLTAFTEPVEPMVGGELSLASHALPNERERLRWRAAMTLPFLFRLLIAKITTIYLLITGNRILPTKLAEYHYILLK
jgi:hypothetical protein